RHPGPAQAAVVGEQDDAGAAAGVRQLIAADRPAGVWVEEVDRPQRGPCAGRLPLPVLAGVDRMPDDAVSTGGPTLLSVHKLDRVQGGVFERTEVGGSREAAKSAKKQRTGGA